MKCLTEDAIFNCDHVLGLATPLPTQDLVTIEGRRVLVEGNPENRPIASCPNIGATIKPCTNTLAVEQGYSDFLRINGQRICLDTVTGLTDGTPPGVVKYVVRNPGQTFVTEVS